MCDVKLSEIKHFIVMMSQCVSQGERCIFLFYFRNSSHLHLWVFIHMLLSLLKLVSHAGCETRFFHHDKHR